MIHTFTGSAPTSREIYQALEKGRKIKITTMKENVIEENILIAEFDGWKVSPSREWIGLNVRQDGKADRWVKPNYFQYHSSWDWLHPVYRKVSEIGIWMMTNGHDKLWLEKSKEIDYAMLHEETPQKAATLLRNIIQFYNTQKTNTP